MTTCKDLSQHILEHEILGISNQPSNNLTIMNGYPVFFDTTRGKTLSIAQFTFFGHKAGRAKNMYLYGPGDLNTAKTGWRMLHNGTITSIAFQTSTLATCDLHIRNANSLTNLYTISLSNELGKNDKYVNIDFYEAYRLQFYIEGVCYNPLVYITVAWRP